MAKTLVNYSEFWYLSRIFHSLFYKLISIFIFLLLTFSIGEKNSARLHRERTVCRHCSRSLVCTHARADSSVRIRMATPFAGKRALVTGAGNGQARVLLAPLDSHFHGLLAVPQFSLLSKGGRPRTM